MKQLIYILLVTFLPLYFSGCSSKQYYEPNDTVGDYEVDTIDHDETIVDFNADGATLENHKFISKDGVTKDSLEDGYKFINNSDGIIIAANDESTLLVKDKNKIDKYKFDKNIISASLKGKYIALGFIDNSIMLYDRDLKKKIFKEYLQVSLVNDIKIANPMFLSSVILYPTLDGKVVIVDIAKKGIIKTINIDPQSSINNVMFLSTIGDTLVAATPKKLFTFVNGAINIKDFDIKHIIVSDKYIFIATLEGEIIKFNEELKRKGSQKFKFAKFHALASGKYIYALESQEYLIQLDGELKDSNIYDFSFNNEEKVITIGDKLYFEDKSITLE